MTKSIPLSRARRQAAAVLGACLLALGCPAAACAAVAPRAKTGGENTPLNLDTPPATARTRAPAGPASCARSWACAIVIAVIWGLSWILRQVKSGRDAAGRRPRAWRAWRRCTLGSGRSVHLVRAGSDYLLLGSAEHGLVPIHRYSEQQAREAGLLGSGASRPGDSARDPLPVGTRMAAARAGCRLAARPDAACAGAVDGLIERLREWTVRR